MLNGVLTICPAADATSVPAFLAIQTNVQTWSADFVQTRTLKSLTQPLTSTGRVVFLAPDSFRWEIGQPAQTIALRRTNEMLVIYPQLKRVERYPLATESRAPWQDMLTLLEAGFPGDAATIESRFRILSATTSNGICRLELSPRATATRKWVSQIQLAFATNTGSLVSTELKFADGSALRNDFTNGVVNTPLNGVLFHPEVPADFKITQPLARSPTR